MTRIFHNPLADPSFTATPDRRALDFHRKLPGYRPTPLRPAPATAAKLGAGRVWVKDESDRLGLPAFKVLGASWAVYLALRERFGEELAGATSLEELRARLAGLGGPRLIAATDGNHGRALARIALWLGLPACIYVPEGMVEARRSAIAGEGADVVVVDGGYEAAVQRAASEVEVDGLLVSDTAWPGYELIPTWVIDGYSTIFWEIEDALLAAGAPAPDLVAVQMGCGAFAASAIRHFRRPDAAARPEIVGVEPLDAACVLASLEAGSPAELTGPQRSIMAGLNCGRPSLVAWPFVARGLDLAVATDDGRAEEAMRLLAEDGIVAGETGAAGLAGLLALGGLDAEQTRLGKDSSVLLIVTEGATDAEAYRRIVGRTEHS